MAKNESLKEKTAEELAKLLLETRAALRDARFAAAGARAKNPSAARAMRKTVARVLTEERARSRAIRQPADAPAAL